MQNISKSNIKDKRAVIKKVLDIVVPILISGVMIAWLFHKIKIHTIIQILRDQCDYRWLLLMCGVEVLSRCIRGLRWGIQLRAAGIKRMPRFAEMVAIFGAYALNLLLTGVGEAWRCLYVADRQKANLSTVIGTDIGDRISDAIMIMVTIGLSLTVASPMLEKFMDTYQLGRDIMHVIVSPWLWLSVAAIIGGIIWIMFAHSTNVHIQKIRTQAQNLWNGFRILFTMKHQIRYWLYTLIIWVAYFLMTYLCFFAFPFTRDLIRPELAYGLIPGLVVFIFASLSIAIPATGGLGPWNLAVIFALSLYNVRSADAAAYSMVVWAFQTVTQVMMGLVAAGYVTYDRHRSQNISQLPSSPKQ